MREAPFERETNRALVNVVPGICRKTHWETLGGTLGEASISRGRSSSPLNEGWLAVCHRQTTWAGPVVHSQSVWQSCDGGMRDDSGCSSQLHHKVRYSYAFVRQTR